MTIKFMGVKGNNRLRLKPKTEDAVLVLDETESIPRPNAVPEKIFDDSYAICLKQAQISCDGAWPSLGILYSLDYSVGWTLYINDIEFGRYTQNDPLEYYGASYFDWMINVEMAGEGLLMITPGQDRDTRIRLQPDSVPPSKAKWVFYDMDNSREIQRDSLNVLVGDDGSISVCLKADIGFVEMPS